MGKNIEYTESQVKGRRLRMARALTGLSRQDLHEKTGIATSTMDTWESGRVELNERSAIRVCESFRKIGISCSAEWLLHGEGMPPHLMSDTERSMFSFDKSIADEKTGKLKQRSFILPPFLESDVKKELSFFLNLHDSSVFHIVKEKFLNSQFEVGDCVAGVEDDPKDLIGKIVILIDQNSNTILCRLNECNDNVADVYLNSRSPVEKIEFKMIARMLWHRKTKG